MKLGIRAHDLGLMENASQMAEAVREKGFETVQLVLHKSIRNAMHEAGSLTGSYAAGIGRAFEREGVEIALLGAYFNWFADDENRGFEKYKEHLKYASRFGTAIVGTEVKGPSSNRWGTNRENDTDRANEHVLKIASELVRTAETYNVFAGIEGASSHVLSTPRKVCELSEKLETENIALIFDLYNFLNLENYDDQKRIIDETLESYGRKLKIVHCKDFVFKGDKLEQVALGEGMLDLSYLVKRLFKYGHDDISLIFEGVPIAGITRSRVHMEKIISDFT